MSKILWVGDAACSSGFGRAAHKILVEMQSTPGTEVAAIGVNFRGDPPYPPYPVYPAWGGGDPLGVGRLKEVVTKESPDFIVLQTNPWNVPVYMKTLYRQGFGKTPVVGIIAVEGKNCVGEDLNMLKRAVFWCKFGEDQARDGGMTIPSDIVPLGVDAEYFCPGDREEALDMLGLPTVPRDAFIVGNVNRNQNRKRLDLSILYFAEWVKTRGIKDAYLYLHVLPGSGTQFDLEQLAAYCGITDRLIYAQPKDVFQGAPEHYVRAAYRVFSVFLNTTLGEGWGLTPMEAMACGCPVIAGDYAALGEWAAEAAYLVPCPDEGIMPDVHNMIGAAPDRMACIDALDIFYRDERLRFSYAEAGRVLVTQPQYRWENIAKRFAEVLSA